MVSSSENLKAGFEEKGTPKSFESAGSRDVPAANMAAFNQLANELFNIDGKLADYNTKFVGGNLLGADRDKINAILLNLEKQQTEVRKKIERLNSKGKDSKESNEVDKKPNKVAGMKKTADQKIPSAAEMAKERLAGQRRH